MRLKSEQQILPAHLGWGWLASRIRRPPREIAMTGQEYPLGASNYTYAERAGMAPRFPSWSVPIAANEIAAF